MNLALPFTAPPPSSTPGPHLQCFSSAFLALRITQFSSFAAPLLPPPSSACSHMYLASHATSRRRPGPTVYIRRRPTNSLFGNCRFRYPRLRELTQRGKKTCHSEKNGSVVGALECSILWRRLRRSVHV